MNRHTQQQHFGNRLRQVMSERGLSIHSPTALMRAFNQHSSGPTITVHAARKWLLGEAIPTQEKLLILSSWLGVGPEWLRFDGDEPKAQLDAAQPSPRATALATAFDGLSDEHMHLVESFVRMLREVPQRSSRAASRHAAAVTAGKKR